MKNKLINLIKQRAFIKSDTLITLSSGLKSFYYFDLRKITLSSEGQFLIGNLIYDIINNDMPNIIGGLTLGADPIACAVAYTSFLKNTPINAIVIRKEPKAHGMSRLIEGDITAKNIVIVDDVITTGKSMIKAIKSAENEGLNILSVIALLDRCESKGRENIESCGYPTYSLLTIYDFINT
jgi:orotate phosphoribosyltransferase